MLATGQLFYNMTRHVSDMCLLAESRIFSCHRLKKSPCLFLLRTVYSKCSRNQLHTNRFVKCLASNRILSVNRNFVLNPRIVTGSSWMWTINRTKPPLVDFGNDVCGLYARELYTTSVFDNKHRTQQNVDTSSKGSEEAESSDPSKGWREDVILTIPNALTISRILLAPVLGYMVLQQSYMLACGMFAYAGITDLLDGYIARRYPSQASSFGSYLDPLADKLLVSTLFISLTVVHLIPVVLTTLVIVRDVLLIGAAFYVRYISLPPPKTLRRYFDVTHATAQLQPTFVSKFNTVVQLSLVAATLAAPVLNYVDSVALVYLWYLTAGTTVASGLSYIFAKNTFRILRETKKQRKAALKKRQQS